MVNSIGVPSKCPETRWWATGAVSSVRLSMTGWEYSGSTQSAVTCRGAPAGATQAGGAPAAVAAPTGTTAAVSASTAARTTPALDRTRQVRMDLDMGNSNSFVGTRLSAS